MLIVGLVLVGYGLWKLSKRDDKSVQVAVDRHGITDFRVADITVPWAEVERIEHFIAREARGFPKPRGLRLVIRANSHLQGWYLGRREAVIWEGGLTGGGQELREAVGRLAPHVPRNWQG